MHYQNNLSFFTIFKLVYIKEHVCKNDLAAKMHLRNSNTRRRGLAGAGGSGWEPSLTPHAVKNSQVKARGKVFGFFFYFLGSRRLALLNRIKIFKTILSKYYYDGAGSEYSNFHT